MHIKSSVENFKSFVVFIFELGIKKKKIVFVEKKLFFFLFFPIDLIIVWLILIMTFLVRRY